MDPVCAGTHTATMPLFACFPVCLTFVALAVIGLLVVATGMYSRAEQQRDTGPAVESRSLLDDSETGPPRWWIIVAIFASLILIWGFMTLISADMKGLWPR